MSLPARGTVISRLRLHGTPADPLAARLRLASALSAAELEPAGLPTTAIVVIRKLRDPQPGRLRLKQPGQPPPLDWQQAVGQRVDALARCAARPAHGFVPDSVDAVLFMDRSELLACLAHDWCCDAIATRWWWRSLLRDPDAARAVLGEWLQGVEYAPQALRLLADSRHATAFVRRLEPAPANALLAGMLDRFGLTELRAPIVEVARRGANRAAEREWHEPPVDDLAPTAVVSRSSPADPFETWVPEARGSGLVREQRLVLGIGLLLQRAPAVVRSQEFAQRVARWAAAPAGESRAAQTDAVSNQVVSGTATTVNGVDRSGASIRAEPQSGEPHPVLVHGAPVVVAPASARQPELTRIDSAEPTGGPVPPDRRAAPERVPERQPAPEPATLPDHRWIDTAQGGALFLVNLGLFLGLYADFSQPAKRGLALSILDFIALVGESLIGRRLRADPLWSLLAELAGRDPADAPGRRYTPPSAWRVPENWLTPFAAADTWEWSARRHRMQVRHPAGFVVLDVPVRERAYRDVLALELAPYRSAGLCSGVVHRAPPATAGRPRDTQIRPPVLRRWCDWLMPYLHARLQTALGTSAADDVGELLCACPARLRITATHLDAHFALANLPIAVRLAGLDRDPGWVPAAGRYIRFHFD